MSIFKCKMCGGDLIVHERSTVCECEYCGSTQTIPVLNSEKKINLFNRANRLRQNSEFDKAATIYASIIAEFPREAEAFWGLCLCKYGIEYVDDPLTGNKIPTCHRTLTSSILDDNDYIQATQNADDEAKPVYESEAKRIDELQQDILRIVKSESPYDVFICYKETDENGNRTEDSVISQEIYDALTGKGLKVFFARITLEEKLGQQYEPYIFAALQSAVVMLVVGTSYENLDAVWVKNEWSRFLDMMKTDRAKRLIPCFKGIDIDEMPKAFQRLQAQDLSKLGWIQDLTRGVEKLCNKTQNSTSVLQTNIRSNRKIDNLDRALVYLEDGLWEKASVYADREIAYEPHSFKAYQTKLLAEMHVRKLDDLRGKEILLFQNENFKRALQYAEGKDREELESIDQELTYRARHKCVEEITRFNSRMLKAASMQEYQEIEEGLKAFYDFPEVIDFRKRLIQAKERFIEVSYRKSLQLTSESRYAEALELLVQLPEYKDSRSLREKCKDQLSKQKLYDEACDLMQRGHFDAASKTFKNLGDYLDSAKLSKKCARKVKVESTSGHKVAVVFHVIFIVILAMMIATYTQNDVFSRNNNTLMIIGILAAIVAPVFAWKFDKKKKTGRIWLDILLCFVALFVIAANVRNYSPIVSSLVTGAFIAVTIFL